MALSTAAKVGLGGLGTVSVGAPTAYVVWDKYFSESLNEVEKDVLIKDAQLTITELDNGADATATTTVKVPGATENTFYKWKCIITAEGVTTINKAGFKTYLEKFLPSSKPNEAEKIKKFQDNRNKFVQACSKNREETSSDNTYTAKLSMTATADNTNITAVDFFSSTESVS